MNLAYKYPIIFWNCANLITDSGGAEREEIDDEEVVREFNEHEIIYVSMEDFTEDDEGEESEEEEIDEIENKVISKKEKD